MPLRGLALGLACAVGIRYVRGATDGLGMVALADRVAAGAMAYLVTAYAAALVN